MKAPKTNQQEILYTLIENGKVSIMDFPYMAGFRKRISEIKNDLNLDLDRSIKTKYNKFNNVYYYAIHKLKLCDVNKAKKIYQQITNKQRK